MKFVSLLTASLIVTGSFVRGEYTVWTKDLGFGCEAVEYDSTNDLYYYADFSTGTLYYADAANTKAFVNGTADYGTFSYGNVSVFFSTPTAMYSDGVLLYMNNLFTGQVIVFNISSKTAIYDTEVYYNASRGIVANVNGMCVDPTDDAFIYVTDAGLNVSTGFSTNTVRGMIYRINVTSGEYERIYDESENIYPNGCTFSSDGTLYAVETNRGNTSRLIMYDGSEWTFVNAPARGDGIVFDSDGTLYYGTWEYENATGGRPGGIYRVDYDSGEDEYSFELIVTGLVSPTDIAYNDALNLLVIPSFNATITIVDLDSDYTTTMADTTTIASGDDDDESTTTSSTTGTGDSDTDDGMANGIASWLFFGLILSIFVLANVY